MDGETLKDEIKALVFDQYGTVVDMQAGLAEIAGPFLADKGWPGEPHRFVTWWRRTHFENSMIDALCDRGHTPYRTIGERAVSHVMDRAGIAGEDGPTHHGTLDIVYMLGIPGMTVTVEIKTGSRRLIEYFLSPLLQGVQESIRER